MIDSYILFAIYTVALLAFLRLAYQARTMPVTLWSVGANLAFIFYWWIARLYRIVNGTNDASTVYNSVALCLFMAFMLFLCAMAIRTANRIKAGQPFTGFDGKPWRTRTAVLPEGDVIKVAQHAERRPSAATN